MDKIYEILTEVHPGYDFKGNDGVIKIGILDSFDIISLVTELEEAYDIFIDALDIIPENFCNVEAIAKLIRKNGGIV